MKIEISKKVAGLAPSGIRAFFDLVLNMKDVISLGVGEPDFVAPWNIREKAIYSLEQGFTSYTSNKGMPELRRQISYFLRHRYGINYDFDEEVLITVGVSEGLDLAIRALLNPSDKVLIPQPGYVSYAPIVELAGGIPVIIKTSKENGFKLTATMIEEAYAEAGSGVRAIILNYPCNPTGTSYTKKELENISKVIKKTSLIVISDEVYDELTYDFVHTPIASLSGMQERVIYLNGFSKGYAMTGFRIGWACGPRKVISAMTKIHQYTILCASITSQMAAIEALKNGHRSLQHMKKEYKRRRRYFVEALNEIGLKCHMPDGAFYAFPSIEVTGEDALSFAQNLLKEEKVAVVPGTAFDSSCKGYVRMSYATSYDKLKEAICRIDRYIKRRKG